jgi:hypothetical protein
LSIDRLAGTTVPGAKAKAKESTVATEPLEPLLPETWDCSISGLRGLLARLRAGGGAAAQQLQQPQQQQAQANTQAQGAAATPSSSSSSSSSLMQAGLVLQQQIDVVLKGAAVPGSRRQLVEGAARWV